MLAQLEQIAQKPPHAEVMVVSVHATRRWKPQPPSVDIA